MAKWIKYILFFGMGVLLLYLAFNNQNPQELIEQLKTKLFMGMALYVIWFLALSAVVYAGLSF